jgi:hypothetical protein
MYHFMFGLRGGSLVAAAPSALAACSAPAAPAAFFSSSSCMIKLNSELAARDFAGLLPPK